MIAFTTHRGTSTHDALLDAQIETGLVCEVYLVGVYDYEPLLRGVSWYRIVDVAPGQETFLWHLHKLEHIGEA